MVEILEQGLEDSDYGEHVLKIEIEKSGLQSFTFTSVRIIDFIYGKKLY